MSGSRGALILALAAALLTAGCLGGLSDADPLTGSGTDDQSDDPGDGSGARSEVRTIETTTHLLIDAETTRCADTAPRCGVVVWGGDGEPPTTKFRISSENATTVNVSAAWNASSPFSEDLELIILNEETDEQVAINGTSPLNATFELAPGSYSGSIGPDPEPAAGVVVDQEVTYMIQGHVFERA